MTRSIEVFVEDKKVGEMYQSEFMSDGKVMDIAKGFVPDKDRPKIKSTCFEGGIKVTFKLKK